MGSESAQKTAGRDWIYPHLIYALTDSYAAVRFDAWKSLQTLPGFSNFLFNFTAPDHALGEAATRAYEKWLREVRDVNSVYPTPTITEPDGWFRQETFQRLRRERDDKPVFLAE